MVTVEEITNFKQTLREQGPKTFTSLLSAIIIWLFSVLVFIPIASSIGKNVELVIVLITLSAFSAIILVSLRGVKNLLDVFSVIPARKYFVKKGLSVESAISVSKLFLYVPSILFVYLLYFPYLVLLHPAINGIVLIFVIISLFLISLNIVSISKKVITDWLYST